MLGESHFLTDKSKFREKNYVSKLFYVLYRIEFIINIPEDFAPIASPKIMSDCHMLPINVCDAGRHAGTQRHEKGLTFIRVRAWLACALHVHDRLFVTQTGRQGHEKGLTFIRVEDHNYFILLTRSIIFRILFRTSGTCAQSGLG